MSVLDNLGINPGLMLIWLIAFIVLYTVMTRFIYDPLTNVLEPAPHIESPKVWKMRRRQRERAKTRKLKPRRS